MRGYFKNLEVWKKSVSLAKSIYQITKDFPKEELFGITSQLRRAVISVSTNIAEWNQRSSNKEYAHFLNIAKSSLVEVESLLEVSVVLELLNSENIRCILQEIHSIKNMIYGIEKSL